MERPESTPLSRGLSIAPPGDAVVERVPLAHVALALLVTAIRGGPSSPRAWGCRPGCSPGPSGRLLRRHPAALVAPFALLVPVAAAASSALVLGERFGP